MFATISNEPFALMLEHLLIPCFSLEVVAEEAEAMVRLRMQAENGQRDQREAVHEEDANLDQLMDNLLLMVLL